MWNWLGITNEPKLGEITAEQLKEANSDTKIETDTTCSDSPEENVTSKLAPEKVKEAAANIGNYLYNFASVASKKAAELKDTVDESLEKTIVGDFNRENEKFVQERDSRRIGDAVAPWVGFHEEEVMKSQILALSSDERNFLRDPPSGVDFQFNLSQMMPVAMEVLKQDSDLKDMRFKLVPKRIHEEKFWKNYFYRVSLIKQSTQLSTISAKENKMSPRSSSTKISPEKSQPEESSRPSNEPHDDSTLNDTGIPTTNEFASDAFDDNAHLSEEEKTQMSLGANESSGDKKTSNNDWEIDQELEQELESFELVNDDDTGNNDGDDEWQKEIDDLLEEEANSAP